jgi:ATP-dependent helicase HepA
MGFLELSHLLDPLVFRLEDGEGFKLRIAKRELLAETVAGLVPANVLQVDGFIDVLLEVLAQRRIA